MFAKGFMQARNSRHRAQKRPLNARLLDKIYNKSRFGLNSHAFSRHLTPIGKSWKTHLFFNRNFNRPWARPIYGKLIQFWYVAWISLREIGPDRYARSGPKIFVTSRNWSAVRNFGSNLWCHVLDPKTQTVKFSFGPNFLSLLAHFRLTSGWTEVFFRRFFR